MKTGDEGSTEGGQVKNDAGMRSLRFTSAGSGQGMYGKDMHTDWERETACYRTPEELWRHTFIEARSCLNFFADVLSRIGWLFSRGKLSEKSHRGHVACGARL